MKEETQELQRFVPEQEELLRIVNHWAQVCLNRHLDIFLYGQVSSWHREMHALNRIEKLEEVLGKDVVNQEVRRVREFAAAQLGPRLWNIFVNGDAEAYRAVAEDTWRKGKKSLNSASPRYRRIRSAWRRKKQQQ